MLMDREQVRLYIKLLQKFSCFPGVFSGNTVCLAEDQKRSEGNIAEISDRKTHDVKCGGRQILRGERDALEQFIIVVEEFSGVHLDLVGKQNFVSRISEPYYGSCSNDCCGSAIRDRTDNGCAGSIAEQN